MKDEPKFFAGNLQFLLTKSGKTKSALANHLGQTPQNIANWISGRNAPKEDVQKKVATFFGVDSWDLGHKDLSADKSHANINVDVGSTLASIDAKADAILSALSEVLSHQTDRLAASVRSELDTLVRDNLRAREQQSPGE